MNVERARRASRGENEGPDDGRAIFIVVAPERRLVNVLYMAAQSKRPRSCCSLGEGESAAVAEDVIR